MVSASATSLIETLTHTGALDRSSLFDVSGWVAVVTGGGTGLGLVSAVTLATNGCIVYIVGRRLEPLEKVVSDFADAADKKGKGSIHAIQADVSTKEGVDELVAFVNGREGHINLLLNNHGVSLGCADINSCEQTAEGLSEQMYNGESMDKWLDTYRINTASYFFTTFAFLPLLAAAGKSGEFAQPGNVINISSISGLTKTSQRGQFNYNASKAATVSLSHMMAYEFARRNLEIRVNVIAPGYFPSGMTVIPKESNDGSDSAYRDFRNNWAIPFGRPGSAADHAQAILSVATNQYMTGAEIVVDGGWMLESAF